MPDLNTWQFAFIALGALFVGLGKGGLPGMGNITIAFLAIALPAKASVGILLPIFLAADVVAVTVYRRHTLWPFILKLAPWTVMGVLAGYIVFSRVDDAAIRLLIGWVLLSMTALHFFRQWLKRKEPAGGDTIPRRSLFAAATGIVGGFATMVANAAGPIAALYFIAAGLPKYAFIGTAAWFFFLVNCFKLPFMVNLGIIDGASLVFSAQFMVFAALGAAIAPGIVRHINQHLFELLIWVFVVIGGFKLIF